MATAGPTFNQWLREAKINRQKLSPDLIAVLEASFRFVQRCGGDYYSRRMLSHFLLHCESGLQVSQIARILGVSRSTASEQQNISSKEMIQIAHHRMAGQPHGTHGKLFARYAGPIAQFSITHPKASRLDILDFIERTWQVRFDRGLVPLPEEVWAGPCPAEFGGGGRKVGGRTGSGPGSGIDRGELARAAGGIFLPRRSPWDCIADQDALVSFDEHCGAQF